MGLFGNRQAVDTTARAEIAALRDELTRTQSFIRQLEQEQVGLHDQVRRWMRRAVAAERAAERNQEQRPHVNGHVAAVTPAPASPAAGSRLTLRGARARIAMRRRLEFEAEQLRRVQEPEADTRLPAAEVGTPLEAEPEGA